MKKELFKIKNISRLMYVVLCLLILFSQKMIAQEPSNQKELSEKISKFTDPQEKINSYLQFARYLSINKKAHFEAKQYADSALIIAKNNNLPYGEMMYWNTYGIIARNGTYYNDALKYHSKALVISKKIKDKEKRPYIYNNIATIMRYTGNYSEAVKIYIEAIKFIEINKNDKAELFLLNGLGNSYAMLKNYDNALQYFNKSLLLANKLNNQESRAINYANIAEVLFFQEKFQEAELYYNKSLKINTAISHKKGISINLKGLGDLNFTQKNYNKAFEYYKKALPKSTDKGNKYITTQILLRLGKTTLKQGKTDIANEYLSEGLQMAKIIDNKKLKQEVYQALSEYAKITGDYKKAYDYSQLYIQMEDSLLNIEIQKSVISTQLKYDLEKSNEHIETLKKENAVREKQNQIKLFSMGISALALLIIVIALFVFRSARQKGKVNKVLKKTVKQKEIMLSEMHHRIKNNFAVVIGLLRLQKKDPGIKNPDIAIENTINRIYTYASIHEKAYEKENYAKIDMGNFIKQLAENIKIKTGRRLVEIVQQTEPVMMKLSSAVSVGLFSNEILSNAFEHGFSEDDSGLVKIKLCSKNSQTELNISNTGKNPGENFDITNTHSAGLHIAQLYARQLKGKFSYENENQEFKLIFKLEKNRMAPFK